MKFLVIGLGSMGKRRIRCLKALGNTDIIGFDLREDRRKEVDIKTYADFEEALKESPDAFIISVPPDKHHIYMKLACMEKIPYFVEASVNDTEFEDVIKMSKGIVAVPSATLMFHPAIQKIKDLLERKELGKISNVILHSGQYLPDWHTYEKVSDYYVSNPLTGAAREIVPFELTWFTKLFGFPEYVVGMNRRTIQIDGARIDDTYNFLMDYGDTLASITVDVVSRFATRRLTINGAEKQLIWNWADNYLSIYDPARNMWEKITYETGTAAEGYNKNIGENMYIDETKAFIDAIKGKPFPNTLEQDWKVLNLLYAIEKSDVKSEYQRV